MYTFGCNDEGALGRICDATDVLDKEEVEAFPGQSVCASQPDTTLLPPPMQRPCSAAPATDQDAAAALVLSSCRASRSCFARTIVLLSHPLTITIANPTGVQVSRRA